MSAGNVTAAMALTVSCGVAVASSYVPRLTGLLVAATITAAVLCRVPAHVLPSIALSAFALLPVNFLPGRNLTTILSPALFVIIVWAIRVVSQGTFHSPRAISVPAICLLLWLLASSLVSVDVGATFGWMVAFLGLAMCPMLLCNRVGPRTQPALVRTWLTLGIVLSLFALVEGALQQNPVFGAMYIKGDGQPLDQVWSVYRVTTTLGHPLMNGTFFAMSFALAVSVWLRARTQATLFTVALTLSGVMLTVSRGAIVAAAGGGGAAVVLALFRGRVRGTRKLVAGVLVPIGVLAVGTSELIARRSASSEGLASGLFRSEIVGVARELSNRVGALGSGPGTSRVIEANTGTVLENSALQLLVALGGTGLVLVAWLIASAIRQAIVRGNDHAVALLVAVVIASAGYNFVEGGRTGLILVGLPLLVAASSPPRMVSARDPAHGDRLGQAIHDNDRSRPSVVYPFG